MEEPMRLKAVTLTLLLLACAALSAQNMFGAFQIHTVPQDAVVTLYGTSQYLGNTPTEVFPVMMDQFMTYYYGTPGRAFSLLITRDGYLPLKQDIFVPYTKAHQVDAMRYPTVFNFYLSAVPVYQPPLWYPVPPSRPPHHGRPHRNPHRRPGWH